MGGGKSEIRKSKIEKSSKGKCKKLKKKPFSILLFFFGFFSDF